MNEYRPRIVDELLREKLDAMGAVLVEGPKYCGKTTTAAQCAGSILYVADPATKQDTLYLAQTDMNQVLAGATPRLIDEWQLIPEIWDAVIHLRNGRYGLVEIKLGGEALINDAVASLNKLENRIDTDKLGRASFKMVLTAVGQYAYRRPNGVCVVPVGCLKP